MLDYYNCYLLDTTDVQSVCGFLEGNEVTLLCLFAKESMAQGCIVTLITDTTNTTTNIMRGSQSGSATANITVNTFAITDGYHLYAQDIEADGSVGLTQLPGNLSTELAICSSSTFKSKY